MKLKIDYVTNSSSCNYIFLDRAKQDPEEIGAEFDFIPIQTEEDIEEYVSEYDNMQDKVRELIKQGEKIYFLVCQEGEALTAEEEAADYGLEILDYIGN